MPKFVDSNNSPSVQMQQYNDNVVNPFPTQGRNVVVPQLNELGRATTLPFIPMTSVDVAALVRAHEEILGQLIPVIEPEVYTPSAKVTLPFGPHASYQEKMTYLRKIQSYPWPKHITK